MEGINAFSRMRRDNTSNRWRSGGIVEGGRGKQQEEEEEEEASLSLSFLPCLLEAVVVVVSIPGLINSAFMVIDEAEEEEAEDEKPKLDDVAEGRSRMRYGPPVFRRKVWN